MFMKTIPNPDQIVCFVIVLLSLAIFVLAVVSPAYLLDTGAVYQGF